MTVKEPAFSGIFTPLPDLRDGQIDDIETGEVFEYGYVPDRNIGTPIGFDTKRQAVDYLIARAKENLSPGTRFEIREKFPGNYGRSRGLAWYRHPAMDADPTWETRHKDVTADNPIVAPEGGYILLGTYTTPSA
jgi:hypothetical protein